METFNDRFIHLSELLGETTYEIAKTLGFSTPQQLYKIVNGKTKDPRVSISALIKENYPKVNLNWLHAGVGEPFMESKADDKIDKRIKELEGELEMTKRK